MPINDLLIREFDREMVSTQKTLERVPADKWDWKELLGWHCNLVTIASGH